jgi:lipoprotein-anchoring transpeptidase ErfK/SrfK
MSVKLASVVAVLAAALAVVPATASPDAPAVRQCRGGVLHPVGTPAMSWAGVVARSDVRAYRRPGKRVLAHFGRLNQNHYPTTFLVVGAIVTRRCTASWYRVKLPMRPNGVIGYVRPADVAVQKVRTRIEVDLSRRVLRFFRGRTLRLKARVAIGSISTPTPIGRFYVNQRLRARDPNGPYGPAALGISAFSDVLQGWTQGGPIAIHGTNAPWSIGQAVSHGCIRLPNATLRRLFAAVPGGTPVVIHP